MKKTVSILNVLVFTFSILIIFFGLNQSTHSDIPMDKAKKTYEVPFCEWVQVMLHVQFAVSQDDYFVVTYPDLINNKVRFIVKGEAFNTPSGKTWYKNVSSSIEERIVVLCDVWTKEGYPISLNDFEINIKAPE